MQFIENQSIMNENAGNNMLKPFTYQHFSKKYFLKLFGKISQAPIFVEHHFV
jgi:hypothetical protein